MEIKIGSFLVGVLVALTFVSIFFSYQANKKIDYVVTFLVQNDLIKTP